MAYENSRLVAAGVSGNIYLARVKGGIMDVNRRRVVIDDVSNLAAE